MLNKKGQRELAYIAQVTNITPIEGAENVELAHVNGWTVMVRKGAFQIGDPCVYFEIDSKVPETAEFEFMEKYKYRVKTQKYFKGKVLSQGLIMTLAELNLTDCKVGDFVTERLGVIYYEVEDNIRKADNKKLAEIKVDKFMERWSRKHPHLSKIKFIYNFRRNRWLKKYFKTQAKKKNGSGWPTGKFPGVSKTDQERCENMPWVLKDKSPFIKTLKVDGTSSTYILEKLKKNKFEYYVCSRNVRMFSKNQVNFHSEDENVYWETSDKYKIREFLEDYINKNNLNWACIQGEVAGCSDKGVAIQGDPHKLKTLRFFGFHMTDSKNGRLNPIEASKICSDYNIDWVPLLDINYILPDDFEEFKLSADGPCDIPGSNGLREGFVYYKKDDPTFSFKNVSNKYLLNH